MNNDSNYMESNENIISIKLPISTFSTNENEHITNGTNTTNDIQPEKKKSRKTKKITMLSSLSLCNNSDDIPTNSNSTTTTNSIEEGIINIRLNNSDNYENIELLPHQIEHTQKIENILQESFFALDFSTMGTGKTYCASYIAKKLNIPNIVVVAPLSVLPKWNLMKNKYGINIIHALSYCSLRSIKCKQPKHGLLTRVDKKIEYTDNNTFQTVTREVTEFFATQMWKNLVQQGVMFIVDEIQNVKNISSQFLSVKELIREIRENNPINSKVILLSGTPIDKNEQIINLYRSIGIINENLSFYYRKYFTPFAAGFRKLLRYHENLLKDTIVTRECKKFYDTFTPPLFYERLNQTQQLEGEEGEEVEDENDDDNNNDVYPSAVGFDPVIIFLDSRKRNYRIWFEQHYRSYRSIVPNAILYSHEELYLYETSYKRKFMRVRPNFESSIILLFHEIFCKYRASAMQIINSLPILKRNMYLYVPRYNDTGENIRNILQKGVALLKDSTGFNSNTNDVENTQNFHGITRAMQLIETAKIILFKNYALEVLENLPTHKIVICLNYTESINDLANLLQNYNPLILNGSTNMNKRDKIIQNFQKNNNDYRLLIGNLQCLSTGIDLDDKDGSFPRFVLVSPNYSIITLEQLIYRFLRTDTKSAAEINFIFGRVYLSNGEKSYDYEELPVLNALAKKSTVLHQVNNSVNSSVTNYKYPGEYDTFEEIDLFKKYYPNNNP